MKTPLQWASAAALLLFAFPAWAVVNVFATVPEWGALVEELGGDNVKVYVATNALQDPHHIEAKPSLIARARNADLVVATGAELEIGWLPLVTQQAGNPRIRPGQPGYFEAAPLVPMLGKPTRLDRADGDVHPGGDPHVQTDPRNILRVAQPLAARLAELDPPNAAYYAARQKDSNRRCDIEAGMAKLLAARVAWSNADNALQIHGGAGYALASPISRVLCDARILSIFEGAAEIQAQVIARGLLAGRN